MQDESYRKKGDRKNFKHLRMFCVIVLKSKSTIDARF